MAVRNYFTLFGFPQQFAVDLTLLRQRFIALQTKFHPDNFVGQSAIEKRAAIELSTQINDGYQVLKDPILRAKYLAKVYGIVIDKELTYQAEPEFLMQQMELREALEDLNASSDKTKQQEYYVMLQSKLSQYHEHLDQLFSDIDSGKDMDSKSIIKIIFELQFYQKIMDDYQVKFPTVS